SRRRHTRSDRDWSSDVCSSDLTTKLLALIAGSVVKRSAASTCPFFSDVTVTGPPVSSTLNDWKLTPYFDFRPGTPSGRVLNSARSEERRVGKEWWTQWVPED